MSAILLFLQLAAVDTIPQITLEEALRRSARADPDYVAAVGAVENAEWSRRAARWTLLFPSISA